MTHPELNGRGSASFDFFDPEGTSRSRLEAKLTRLESVVVLLLRHVSGVSPMSETELRKIESNLRPR